VVSRDHSGHQQRRLALTVHSSGVWPGAKVLPWKTVRIPGARLFMGREYIQPQV